ncbi:MAG: hypothetical protein PHG05_01665 [Candidatus Nanoarchaeia archaeon]|nr:hypothetical protein [Candidatus Nanoarchaeia archaeon]
MKRGQVSLFVIIGIIIVVVLGAFIAFREVMLNKSNEILTGEKEGEEIESVKNFVESCLQQVTFSGSQLMGLQGGYLDVEDDNIPISDFNKVSNKLSFGDLEVPYWYYRKANNVDKLQYPSLGEIEKNLGIYVKSNLDLCLNNFSGFSGYNIKTGEKEVKISIENNEIGTGLNMPTTIKRADKEFKIEDFSSVLESDFGELYKIAVQILEQENTDYFLEEKTIDMLTVYDDIPYSGTEFSCGAKVWMTEEVNNKLKAIVETNIPNIKIIGTRYANTEKYFEWRALKKSYDININLRYLQSWPFETEVTPNEGEILVAQGFSGTSNNILPGGFCINEYQFAYNIRYPVLFTLNSDKDIFQFATMVVIEKNQPRKDTLSNNNISMFNNKICNSKTQLVRIRTIDIKTNEEAPAKLSYNCGFSNCYIGESSGVFDGYFPGCVNGYLTAENEFGVGNKILSTTKEDEAVIYLEPYYNLGYEVRLINKNTGAIRKVENENVFFEFKSDNYNTIVSNKEGILKIIPGTYKVRSYIIDEEGKTITIPERTIVKCVDVPDGILGLIGQTKSQCVENIIPEQKIKQNLIGGGEFEFSLSRDQLNGSNKILLYAIYDDSDLFYEDASKFTDEFNEYTNSMFFEYPELV